METGVEEVEEDVEDDDDDDDEDDDEDEDEDEDDDETEEGSMLESLVFNDRILTARPIDVGELERQ